MQHGHAKHHVAENGSNQHPVTPIPNIVEGYPHQQNSEVGTHVPRMYNSNVNSQSPIIPNSGGIDNSNSNTNNPRSPGPVGGGVSSSKVESKGVPVPGVSSDSDRFVGKNPGNDFDVDDEYDFTPPSYSKLLIALSFLPLNPPRNDPRAMRSLKLKHLVGRIIVGAILVALSGFQGSSDYLHFAHNSRPIGAVYFAAAIAFVIALSTSAMSLYLSPHYDRFAECTARKANVDDVHFHHVAMVIAWGVGTVVSIIPLIMHPIANHFTASDGGWHATHDSSTEWLWLVVSVITIFPVFGAVTALAMTLHIAICVSIQSKSSHESWLSELSEIKTALVTGGVSVVSGSITHGGTSSGSRSRRGTDDVANLYASQGSESPNLYASRGSTQASGTILIDRWSLAMRMRDDILELSELIAGYNTAASLWTTIAFVSELIVVTSMTVSAFHADIYYPTALLAVYVSFALIAFLVPLGHITQSQKTMSSQAISIIDELFVAGARREINVANASSHSTGNHRIIMAPFPLESLTPFMFVLTDPNIGAKSFGTAVTFRHSIFIVSVLIIASCALLLVVI